MNTTSDKNITTVYRAYKVLMAMLKDRGYEIADASLNITIEGLKEKLGPGQPTQLADGGAPEQESTYQALNNSYQRPKEGVQINRDNPEAIEE